MNILIEGNYYLDVYSKLVDEILNNGSKKNPRGQGTSFIQNCLLSIKNPGSVFSCEARKYMFGYLNKELKLYFDGDCSADKFGEASKFWLNLKNPDNSTINSNYGYLVFYKNIENKFEQIKNQWTFAKNQLLHDIDTRQALIFISSPHVQFFSNKDFICTLNYIFNIEDNKLHITVQRRSNDLKFGFPYDYAFEYLLLFKMCKELREEKYKDLELGSYNMMCNNIHIYDRDKEQFLNVLTDIKNGNYTEYDLLDKVDKSILDNYVFNNKFGNEN